MADADAYALGNALYNALAGDALWGNRVWISYVPPNQNYPYIWIVLQGGGDRNNTNQASDPQIVMSITGSSLDDTEAWACQRRIQELLDNQADQDSDGSPSLSGGDDWDILTASKGPLVYMEETIDEESRVFRAGNQYVFTMEAK